jgi:hypothetical protein
MCGVSSFNTISQVHQNISLTEDIIHSSDLHDIHLYRALLLKIFF